MNITAMKQALEALEANQPVNYCMNNNGEKFPMIQEDPFRFERNTKAIMSLREAIEQAEQAQPVAWFSMLPGNRLAIKISGKPTEGNWQPLYTAPPQRQPLTDEEIKPFVQKAMKYYGYDPDKYGKTTSAGFYVLARAIEAAHGIKQKNA